MLTDVKAEGTPAVAKNNFAPLTTHNRGVGNQRHIRTSRAPAPSPRTSIPNNVHGNQPTMSATLVL